MSIGNNFLHSIITIQGIRGLNYVPITDVISTLGAFLLCFYIGLETNPL